MKIDILGAHNCESQNSKFVTLLIDDILAVDAGGLASSLSFSAQQKLLAILLTHQHYDHVKDIPVIGMNLFLRDSTTNIYSTQAVYDMLTTHLLNDKLYPNFLKQPEEKPTIRFNLIKPGKSEQIKDYGILAITVKHGAPTVGYQITAADGKAVFYTGDTGPGLSKCWEQVSPQLLIIEVTAPNEYEQWAVQAGHLTPGLLKQELINFRKLKGYLPPVITVHMNPKLEKEIEDEIAAVAGDLGSPINLAYEGMQLDL